MSSRTQSRTQKAAAAYLSRGWCAIPVPYASKNPNRKGWETERYEPADVARSFAGQINIGIHCGAPSGGLVTVDLDTPEAIMLAPLFLPPTERTHGRKSAPASHWWYQAQPAPDGKKKYQLPAARKGEKRRTLVELLSTGSQAIVPPSIHKDTAEEYTWDATGEPAVIDGRVLTHQVERLAACCLLAEYWNEGLRHDLALAVAGTLLRHGWDVDAAWGFVEATSRAAGDVEQLREHRQAVYDTLDALDRDDPATGIPTLIELLTDPVARLFLRWLGIEQPRTRVVVQAAPKPTNGRHEPVTRSDPEIVPEDEDADPEWMIPSDAPAVEIVDLPYWLNRLVRHIEPYTPMFPTDWPVMMTLPFWSILWPGVHLQNLNLAIWALGLGGQSVGKNIGTDELRRVVRAVSNRDLILYSAGSPEGMWDALEGAEKQMLAYHDEYAGYLKLMARDHMSYAKEALCSLYDGRGVNYHRAQKRTINIEDPIVAVCATTTPGAFRDHATVEDMRDGYLSRFLFCAPDRKRISPRLFPRSGDQDREQLVRDLTSHLNRLRSVTQAHYASTASARDPELIEQYRQHHEMDTGEIETLEEAMEDRSIPPGRLLARIKKVAALFALAEEAPELDSGGRTIYVTDEHVRLATIVVERGRFYATRARSWIDENEDVRLSDRILKTLVKEPKGQTRRDLCRRLNARAGDVKAALELLTDGGQVISERAEGSRAVYWFAVKLRGTQ